MYNSCQPLFLFCETPLHAGSGNDLGIIDLPIQREAHTGFPKIESSGLKGSLREAFEKNPNADAVKIHKVFGYDNDAIIARDKPKVENAFKDKKDREFAGALTVTDARILLFPVKSQKGVFAWITCNRVLNRFETEMTHIAKMVGFPSLGILAEGSTGTNSNILDGKTIRLEEYAFSGCSSNPKISELGNWIADKLYPSNTYWNVKMQKDIVVLSDEDFADFVNHSTEVITRTKIDNETGTVSDTALFTEEFLPAESLMYSLVMFAPEFKKNGMDAAMVKSFFEINQPEVFQIGGNASLGKGIVRTKSKSTQQSTQQNVSYQKRF